MVLAFLCKRFTNFYHPFSKCLSSQSLSWAVTTFFTFTKKASNNSNPRVSKANILFPVLSTILRLVHVIAFLIDVDGLKYWRVRLCLIVIVIQQGISSRMARFCLQYFQAFCHYAPVRYHWVQMFPYFGTQEMTYNTVVSRSPSAAVFWNRLFIHPAVLYSSRSRKKLIWRPSEVCHCQVFLGIGINLYRFVKLSSPTCSNQQWSTKNWKYPIHKRVLAIWKLYQPNKFLKIIAPVCSAK